MKGTLGKLIAGLVAASTVATLCITSVLAATTSFDNPCQSNVNTEQSLLVQVSPSSTSTTVSALLSTAQNINTQVAALHSLERALEHSKTSVPPGHPYDTGMKSLQCSILKLKNSSLHYSKEAMWIQSLINTKGHRLNTAAF